MNQFVAGQFYQIKRYLFHCEMAKRSYPQLISTAKNIIIDADTRNHSLHSEYTLPFALFGKKSLRCFRMVTTSMSMSNVHRTWL